MLKGEVKPAAIMESSRKVKSDESSAVATAEAPKKSKGWIASLFN
jgi:hypothetical protein